MHGSLSLPESMFKSQQIFSELHKLLRSKKTIFSVGGDYEKTGVPGIEYLGDDLL